MRSLQFRSAPDIPKVIGPLNPTADSIPKALVLASIVAASVPLAMVPWWFLYFDATPKVALLLLGTAFLLLNVRHSESAIARISSFRTGQILIAGFAIQLLSLFVSSVVSKSPVISFFGTGWRRFGAVEGTALVLFSLLLAASLSAHSSGLRILLRTLSVSGTLGSIYGILQYVDLDPFIDSTTYRLTLGHLSFVRPPGTIGHATYFADYLVMTVFLSLASAILDDSRLWRIAGFAGAGLAALALVLTGTRAGVLGLAIAGVFLIVRLRPKVTKRALYTIVLIAATVISLYFAPPGERLRNRVAASTLDNPGGPRMLLWRDCLAMARPHLFLGTGPEMFSLGFPKYESRALARAYPDVYHETPHNICLDSLLAQGLPGFLVLITLTSAGVWASFGWKDRKTAAVLAAGLVGLFVSQQFTAFVVPTAFLFYLIVAVLMAGKSTNGDPQPIGWGRIRLLRAFAIPVAGLLLVVAAQMIYVDSSWASINRALREGHLEDAVRQYPGAARIYPPESGSELWYSRILVGAIQGSSDEWVQRRAWDQALDAAARAVASPENRPNAWYNLAVLHYTQGDVPRAEAALKEAIQSAPQWFKPHWLLAELFLGSARLSAAQTEAETAIDLGAPRPELEDLRAQIRARQSQQR